MAVSKRTRFEVLKRDNHTCRYCGGTAPDVVLTVDHVMPVSLGGSDDPSNLVAACKDCNAGKASTSPDGALVADVAADAMRWARAIQQVARARGRQQKKRAEYVAAFTDEWSGWHYGFRQEPIPRPSSWLTSIERFYEVGVPADEMRRCVQIACGNERISPDETFRYFAGCMWRVVTEMQDAAKQLLDTEANGGA